MKSFKAFCKQLDEASEMMLEKKILLGGKTTTQYRTQYDRAKKQMAKATNALAPAKRRALDDLWYNTFGKVMDQLISIEYGNTKPSDSKAKKMDALIAKWEKEGGPLLDAAKKNMDAAAAKWANEKDPCKRIFQKTIFQEIGGSEIDTDKEADIWTQVAAYVSAPGDYGVVKKAYTELIKCKGSYSQLEPGVKAIYRGINVSLKTALKLVNISKLTDKKSSMSAKIGPKQMLGHATKYSPRKPVESWSSNPNVSYGFASGENSMSGSGYYEFSLSELRKSVNTLKRLIAKQQKIASKEKKSEGDKDDLWSVKDEIAYEIQDYINVYMASDSPVPVVYQITPDKYCVMNPLFSNKIGNVVGVGNEFEVTRIETNVADATVWIPQEVIDGAYLVAEIQDLIKQTKIKTPTIKVAVPVKLKKGR
jgi:hypothetical protein